MLKMEIQSGTSALRVSSLHNSLQNLPCCCKRLIRISLPDKWTLSAVLPLTERKIVSMNVSMVSYTEEIGKSLSDVTFYCSTYLRKVAGLHANPATEPRSTELP